jgi:hypothetical protein
VTARDAVPSAGRMPTLHLRASRAGRARLRAPSPLVRTRIAARDDSSRIQLRYARGVAEISRWQASRARRHKDRTSSTTRPRSGVADPAPRPGCGGLQQQSGGGAPLGACHRLISERPPAFAQAKVGARLVVPATWTAARRRRPSGRGGGGPHRADGDFTTVVALRDDGRTLCAGRRTLRGQLRTLRAARGAWRGRRRTLPGRRRTPARRRRTLCDGRRALRAGRRALRDDRRTLRGRRTGLTIAGLGFTFFAAANRRDGVLDSAELASLREWSRAPPAAGSRSVFAPGNHPPEAVGAWPSASSRWPPALAVSCSSFPPALNPHQRRKR